MSERRLKLGHRKEYKRKSKHTRNPRKNYSRNG